MLLYADAISQAKYGKNSYGFLMNISLIYCNYFMKCPMYLNGYPAPEIVASKCK